VIILEAFESATVFRTFDRNLAMLKEIERSPNCLKAIRVANFSYKYRYVSPPTCSAVQAMRSARIALAIEPT
jgi:hypothetical protein